MPTSPSLQVEDLRKDFGPVAERFGMSWELGRHGAKRRVMIMVSKFGHCLNDLLFRARTGELPVEIVAVVSNHRDHQRLVEWHGIPFFHIPVTPATKPEAEAKLLELVDRFEVDLVVLARYMQVLSDDLCRKLEGRVINIHHSFLPSFKGAKPYHQAYERGVKTVGATAHYVNSELDEGPIIAQQLVDKGCQVAVVDQFPPRDTDSSIRQFQQDLDQAPAFPVEEYQYLLMLDVIEHLKDPEQFLECLLSHSGHLETTRAVGSTK